MKATLSSTCSHFVLKRNVDMKCGWSFCLKKFNLKLKENQVKYCTFGSSAENEDSHFGEMSDASENLFHCYHC